MLNLRHLDFAMLMAFDALMRELNVSRAAEKMYVTQSAMSQTLQRLRQQFEDPLLVRTPTGMKPTERALALIDPVRALLRNVEQVFAPPLPFDASTSRERFAIAGSDYIEFMVLPRLIARVRQLAPGVEIQVVRCDQSSLETRLTNEDIDVAMGFQTLMRLPAHLKWQRLFDDEIVCVASRHADIADAMSLEQYLESGQLLISSCDMNAQIMEKWLCAQGLERLTPVIIPNFLSAPYTVASSDLLLSLPRRIAEACIGSSPLKRVEVPFNLPPYDVIMAWHPLRDNAPAHVWLREQIAAVSRDIDAEGNSAGP